jgi:hypothetical protein
VSVQEGSLRPARRPRIVAASRWIYSELAACREQAVPAGQFGLGTERKFVVVPELKRHLIGYAWVIALRELLRIPQIPVEIRRGSVVLAGLVTGRG